MHYGNLVVADSLEACTIVRDACGYHQMCRSAVSTFRETTQLYGDGEHKLTCRARFLWKPYMYTVALSYTSSKEAWRGKGIRALVTNLKSVLSAMKQYFDLRTVKSSSKANDFVASDDHLSPW